MAPMTLTPLTTTLFKRQYYYYSPGLSTGAIVGISIASILIFILAITGCIRRARYTSYYGNTYPPPAPYAYRTADGQPVMPIYSTASGNPAYPQTELGQTAPRAPDAAVISGQRGPLAQAPMYAAGARENEYYAPRTGK